MRARFEGKVVLVIGGNSGTVIPNNRLGSMGGAPVFNMTFHGAPSQPKVESQRNDTGGFDVAVMFGELENYMAGNVSQGTGSLLPALKGRLGLRDAV